jgi:hypothetical protein
VVAEAIRNLNDEEVSNFLQTGSINVKGYDLNSEEMRVMFSVSERQGTGEPHHQYEAHSDGKVWISFFFFSFSFCLAWLHLSPSPHNSKFVCELRETDISNYTCLKRN